MLSNSDKDLLMYLPSLIVNVPATHYFRLLILPYINISVDKYTRTNPSVDKYKDDVVVDLLLVYLLYSCNLLSNNIYLGLELC